jgi:hypothetical protein
VKLLVFEAYAALLQFDFFGHNKPFAEIVNSVRACEVQDPTLGPRTIDEIVYALNLACVFYWKKVLCLERSVVLSRLLRRRCIPAVIVLGAKQMPFRAHAWIQIAGKVVNDKPYIREIYQELDRC